MSLPTEVCSNMAFNALQSLLQKLQQMHVEFLFVLVMIKECVLRPF